jgi:hypothetical protein
MVWKSAYELQLSRATLEALVRKGWAESKITNGYMFSPRTCIFYRARRPTKDAADYRKARGILQGKGIDAVEDIRKLRGG